MASSGKIDLLAGRIPTFEEFFASESLTESLDFSMLLDGISSVPLYERMNIKKELLSADELKQMDLEAQVYHNKYKKRLKEKSEADKTTKKMSQDTVSHMQCSPIKNYDSDSGKFSVENKTIQVEELNKTIENVNEDRGNAERFLKYLYNTNENNLLITTLQKNINFDVHPKSPEKSSLDNETNFSLKNLEDYFNDISNGKYDDFAFRHPSPLPPSSESESDEEISSKAREFSAKFKMSTNDYKYAFLKNIVEDSLKNREYVVEKNKSQIQPNKWISSDDDSETEEQRVRQTEQELKRKKRKGTKNKNRTLPQSKQKHISDPKLDNTNEPKPDNTIRSKEAIPSKFKQNNTNEFTDNSAKNKDLGKNYNPPKDKRSIAVQKYESLNPVSCSKQSKYAEPRKETVHDVNIFPESENTSSTKDKGFKKKASGNNPKKIRSVSDSGVLKKNSESNINVGESICNSKQEGFKENFNESIECIVTKTSDSGTPENVVVEKQIMGMNQSTSSGNDYEHNRKQINKNPLHYISDQHQKELPEQFISEDCGVAVETTKTNNSFNKTESEKQNGSSSSSDEDWAQLAQKSLSVVDKILKHTSKK